MSEYVLKEIVIDHLTRPMICFMHLLYAFAPFYP